MQKLFRAEFDHVNGERPRRELTRASAPKGNGLSKYLPGATGRTIAPIPEPYERANSHSAGLLLLGAFLRPLYLDEEAVCILSYPEIPRSNKRFDEFLMGRIKSLLPKQDSNSHARFPSEITSGKRQYQLRVFTLKSHIANGAGPSLAILLERNHRASPHLRLVARKFRLTQRETEALGLLMQGYTTRQTASRMDISPNTAKSFLRSVMFKTDACDRSGILAKVMQAFELCKGLEPPNETHNHLAD